MHKIIAKPLSIMSIIALSVTAAHAEPFTLTSGPLPPEPTISLSDLPSPTGGGSATSPFHWMHLRLDSAMPSPTMPGLQDPARYTFQMGPTFGRDYCEIADQLPSIADYVAQARLREGNLAARANNTRTSVIKSKVAIGHHAHLMPLSRHTAPSPIHFHQS